MCGFPSYAGKSFSDEVVIFASISQYRPPAPQFFKNFLCPWWKIKGRNGAKCNNSPNNQLLPVCLYTQAEQLCKHTHTLCPVFVVQVWVLGFVSRDPLAEMFIVDWTVKAPQKFHFLTQCDQKPNHTLHLQNMHAKSFFTRNYPSDPRACGVLVWCLGSSVSLLAPAQDWIYCPLPACQGIQCVVCVCLYVCVHACFCVLEFKHACAPNWCMFMWVFCAPVSVCRCAHWGGSGCVCLN